MTEVMTQARKNQGRKKSSPQLSFSLPMTLLVGGVLMIGASFLPLGNWAARSQWTPEDSATYDRVSNEYKLSAYQSPARAGLSQAEWDAQRDKMKLQIQALQQRLDRAKSQPKRWSGYLLGVGCLLVATGFFANVVRRS